MENIQKECIIVYGKEEQNKCSCLLGTKVVLVIHGLKTLKEAVDSAFDSYVKNYKDSIYCINSALGRF